MWVNQYSYSSDVYAKLAEKNAQFDKINQEQAKPTFQKEEASFKLDQLQNTASSTGELSSADAQITKTANLNKMLILSKGDNDANQ